MSESTNIMFRDSPDPEYIEINKDWTAIVTKEGDLVLIDKQENLRPIILTKTDNGIKILRTCEMKNGSFNPCHGEDDLGCPYCKFHLNLDIELTNTSSGIEDFEELKGGSDE